MYLLQGRVPNPRKCFCVRQGPCTPPRVRCSAVSACPRSLCKRQGYVEPGEGRVPTQCSGGQPAAACLGSHACILQYHPSQATRWLGSARSRAIAAARPQGSRLSWCSGAKASGAEWTWPGLKPRQRQAALHLRNNSRLGVTQGPGRRLPRRGRTDHRCHPERQPPGLALHLPGNQLEEGV